METKINMETGYNPEKYDKEVVEEDLEEGSTIEDLIEKVRAKCEHVFDNQDNGNTLDEIFELAETNYEKDKSGWEELLTDLRGELEPVDDEDDILVILDRYSNRASSLLS